MEEDTKADIKKAEHINLKVVGTVRFVDALQCAVLLLADDFIGMCIGPQRGVLQDQAPDAAQEADGRVLRAPGQVH